MVENKQARYVVGAWEPALETIFRHHPSAKLAYTGRLDINDFMSVGISYVLVGHFITSIDLTLSQRRGKYSVEHYKR